MDYSTDQEFQPYWRTEPAYALETTCLDLMEYGQCDTEHVM